MTNPIIFSDSAATKVHELIEEEGNDQLKLRVYVSGGGCSGFQYGFTWDNKENDDDFSFVISDKLGVLVDAISMQYLTGAILKFKQELGGSNFVIENPNSTSKCGCGSSFAV